MAPKKGSSPFSRVESPQLLDSYKRWYSLSNNVCGDRPPKYFSRNRLPARYSDHILSVKRSDLRTVDGAPLEDYEIVASPFGLIAILFLRPTLDAQLFNEETSLNGLDLSKQANGALTGSEFDPAHIRKAIASRRSGDVHYR